MRNIVAIAALAGMTAAASAQPSPPVGQCPATAKSCIVVTMTPEEVNTLVGQNGIFDLAMWANRAGMESLVTAWKQKLQSSPAGKLPEPPKPEGNTKK